jgi:AcrR family transcriptional regulator
MTDTSPTSAQPRARIVEALMALLAERRFEEIGLADVASRAGVSLAEMRGEFSSIMGILAEHVKEVDRKVLAGTSGDEDESVRDRLFDVLMRRLEALTPHRRAIKSLIRSSSCNPGLAMALNGLGIRSQLWMMTAAGISTTGPKSLVRAQALNLLFARVVCVWVDDDDPGLARTMAVLDRELARAARWSGFLDDLFCIPDFFLRRRWRARRRPAAEDDAMAV